MNRREFLVGTLTAAVAARLGSAEGGEAKAGAPGVKAPLFAVKPYAQLLTVNSLCFVWETSVSATGRLTWRQEETAEWREAAGWEFDGLKDANETHHRAILEEVDPTKPVYWRVHSRPIVENKVYSVVWGGEEETLGGSLEAILPDRKNFSFVMLNDIHGKLSTYPELLKLLGGRVAFSVFAGDVFNETRSAAFVRETMLAPFGEWMEGSKAPLWYLRGNHETRAAYARHLRDHVALKDGRYYGAVTIGETRLVFLDTGEDKEDSHEEYFGTVAFDRYLAAETKWLEREVASAAWREARHRIVIGHIPPATHNYWENETYDPTEPRLHRLFKVLDKADVSLFCGGHLHHHGFEAPIAERPYPLVVGGGPDAACKYEAARPTITRVEISPKGIRIRQQRIDGVQTIDQTI